VCKNINLNRKDGKFLYFCNKKNHIMKKLYIFTTILFLFFLIEINSVQAQRNEWVNQVIVVNGGKFESTPPYSDFVTVQKVDPATHAVTVFDKIYTQSVQDLIIDGHFAYVAAQDSIIKYDIDTYERVAAIADSGLAKLYKYGNKVLVSKQYPIKRFFLEVLDDNLSLLARVQGISGECGGITSGEDTVFVAVNGGWSGTEGKIARVKTSNWTVVGETNFGSDATGIWNLYNYADKIYCINKTPTGNPNRGSITVYDIFQGTFINKVLDVLVGDGVGIKENLLYLKMNEGLGSFDLNTRQIADTTIIPDPGSANRRYITSASVDYINDLFYINIGNRSSIGYGKIASLAGDSIASYTAGINADAVAIDYRSPVGISTGPNVKDFVTIYPNPVTELLTLSLNSPEVIKLIKITDLTGRIIHEKLLDGSEKTLKFSCENLHSGVYLISFLTDQGMKTRKFIKK
jgi:hypothetical protein